MTDKLFGIRDEYVPSDLSDARKAEVLSKIGEKRWSIYVAKAARRFEAWWEKCVEPGVRPLRQKDIPVAFASGPTTFTSSLHFGKDDLPPLGKYRIPQ